MKLKCHLKILSLLEGTNVLWKDPPQSLRMTDDDKCLSSPKYAFYYCYFIWMFDLSTAGSFSVLNLNWSWGLFFVWNPVYIKSCWWKLLFSPLVIIDEYNYNFSTKCVWKSPKFQPPTHSWPPFECFFYWKTRHDSVSSWIAKDGIYRREAAPYPQSAAVQHKGPGLRASPWRPSAPRRGRSTPSRQGSQIMPGASESQLTDGIMKGWGGQLLLSGRGLSPFQQVCSPDTAALRAALCHCVAYCLQRILGALPDARATREITFAWTVFFEHT